MSYNGYDPEYDSDSEYNILAYKFKINPKKIEIIDDCNFMKTGKKYGGLSSKKKIMLLNSGVNINHLFLDVNDFKCLYDKLNLFRYRGNKKQFIREKYGEITQIKKELDFVIFRPEILYFYDFSEDDLINIINSEADTNFTGIVNFAKQIDITPNLFMHLIKYSAVINRIDLYEAKYIDVSNSEIRNLLYNRLIHIIAFYYDYNLFIDGSSVKYHYNKAIDIYENNKNKFNNFKKIANNNILNFVKLDYNNYIFNKSFDYIDFYWDIDYAKTLKELSKLINEQEKEIERLSNIIRVGQLKKFCNHEKRMILSYL